MKNAYFKFVKFILFVNIRYCLIIIRFKHQSNQLYRFLKICEKNNKIFEIKIIHLSILNRKAVNFISRPLL